MLLCSCSRGGLRFDSRFSGGLGRRDHRISESPVDFPLEMYAARLWCCDTTALTATSASSVLFNLTKYFGAAEITDFLFQRAGKGEVDEVRPGTGCSIQTVSQLSVWKKEGERLTVTSTLKKQYAAQSAGLVVLPQWGVCVILVKINAWQVFNTEWHFSPSKYNMGC